VFYEWVGRQAFATATIHAECEVVVSGTLMTKHFPGEMKPSTNEIRTREKRSV
jgi:hypothetical protein